MAATGALKESWVRDCIWWLSPLPEKGRHRPKPGETWILEVHCGERDTIGDTWPVAYPGWDCGHWLGQYHRNRGAG